MSEEGGSDGPSADATEGGADGGIGDSGGPPITETETCAAREDTARWNAGRTLYADDTPGCAGHTPCFDGIGAAITAAASGDTVLVLPGTYSGGLGLRQTTELASLRIRALEGPSVTTITQPCARITGADHGSGEIWIEGFTFRDCGGASSSWEDGWGVYVTSWVDADVRILNNVFTGKFGRGGVGLSTSTVNTRFHAVVARNRFFDHEGEDAALVVDLPAHAGDDQCVRIENNVIARSKWGLALDYAWFGEGDARFEIANNTFFGNQVGLYLTFPPAPHKFVNNILFGNTADFSPTTEIEAPFDMRHNLIGSGAFSGLNGNFAADPQFVNAASGDFRLGAASPAADRGDRRGTALVDIDGTQRTDPPDLGAYERREPAGQRLPGLSCGDGVIQNGPVTTSQGNFVGFEACDDGNTRNGDGCTALCQLEAAPPRQQISLSSTHLCAIRADRSLACWGEHEEELVPVGSFRQVTASAYYGCALRDDGTASCWSASVPPGPTFAPPGRFTQISSDYSQTCGLREDSSITCWDDRAIKLEQAGPFKRVDTNNRVCGLSASGAATCFPPYTSFPSGPFLQLFPDINLGGCGLRPTGELVCLPDGSSVVNDSPRAALVQLHVEGTRACALRPDGRAVFWRSSDVKLIDARRFIEVTPGGLTFCCGLTADRRVWCSENSYGFPAE